MARKKLTLSTEQREKRLIELIRDAEELGFNVCLIKRYESQLKEVQAEIQADKEKRLNFNRIERGLKTEC